MARWILNNRKTSTIILVLLFINQQLLVRRVSDAMGVLMSGIFVLGACAIGIYLCKYKLTQCDKACR